MSSRNRARKNVSLTGSFRGGFVNYLMLLPAVLYTIVFGYLTIPYMFTAFQRFNFRTGLLGSKFVGLSNFEFFFKSQAAMNVIGNTVKLNLLFIVCTLVVSVTVALLLNELKNNRLKKNLQSTYLLPYFLSWIIVNYIVYTLTASHHGIFNTVMRNLGLKEIQFYTDGRPWPAILVIAKVWKDFGMNVVIYLAVITGIDSQIYEAAMVDGANRWQVMWYITLRLLMPTVSMLTILAVGKMFYGDFGMIYALVGDNGLLQKTTDVIDTYVFRTLRTTGNPSQAMAIGLFQAVLGFIMVWGSNRVVRRLFQEGALF